MKNILYITTILSLIIIPASCDKEKKRASTGNQNDDDDQYGNGKHQKNQSKSRA